jgi:VanZ family protein
VSHQSQSFKQDAAAVLATAGIACLLLMPGSIFETTWLAPPWRHSVDSVAHGVLFFVLAILVWRSARSRSSRAAAATPGFCLAYATLLEFLQIPIPGRTFETIDIVAAFLGILAALGWTLLVRRRPPEQETGSPSQ